ncbi:hypothetical protein BpHYR1_011984 [Brachionus plicatilis]|uniref:Uncharacterized protein n=1 Tax=Brachionus plicatilis TaxID=10195 RepID=A0A3M7S035_BRAPC|nr:hypothetical protein BpHYR1_011984 [Brachionus plicatilis]
MNSDRGRVCSKFSGMLRCYLLYGRSGRVVHQRCLLAGWSQCGRTRLTLSGCIDRLILFAICLLLMPLVTVNACRLLQGLTSFSGFIPLE